MLETILYFFLALFPLVLVHELGHFVVAKLNGIHVEEFGIGFPPRVATLFSYGGTAYTINALPLGGFVRLLGEDDPTVPGAFAAKGKLARAAVLVAGPAANFLFAALILTGLALNGIPEPTEALRGVSVTSVDPTAPAAAAGIEPGDVIVTADGQALQPEGAPHSGPEALIEATNAAVGQPMVLGVIRPEVVNVNIPALGLITQPSDLPWLTGRIVTEAPPGSAIRAGDAILERESGSLVVRHLEPRSVTVTPVMDPDAGVGRIGVGITAARLTLRYGALAAVDVGFRMTGKMLSDMVTFLGEMFTGQRAVEVSGPVGIARISSQSAEAGPMVFLLFMAVLSLNLGVINLFPIPALDGGRLVFIAFEAIRGRRMEPSREQWFHLVGFVMVIGLMLVLTAVELGVGRGE